MAGAAVLALRVEIVAAVELAHDHPRRTAEVAVVPDGVGPDAHRGTGLTGTAVSAASRDRRSPARAVCGNAGFRFGAIARVARIALARVVIRRAWDIAPTAAAVIVA